VRNESLIINKKAPAHEAVRKRLEAPLIRGFFCYQAVVALMSMARRREMAASPDLLSHNLMSRFLLLARQCARRDR
jgi:hypothetical protein